MTKPFTDDELRRLVVDATTGLDERDRVVLDLHVRQELVGQELADAVGVSEGHAAVLLHRVKERFERSVGALLVARHHSRTCPELDDLLAGWDGTFSPLVRKRVARHAERCEVCGEEHRRLVSPLTALAALPPIPAPAHLRRSVLDRAQLVAHRSRLSRGSDGFPPPMGRPGRRRMVAAAAVVAMLVALAAFGAVDDEGGEAVATGDTQDIDASEPTVAPDDPATTAAPTTEARTTSTTTSAGAAGGTATTGSTTTTTALTTTTPATTTTPTTTTPTTTTPADTAGPTIGSLGATPSVIDEDGSAQCTNTTSSVSVTIDDPSGVDSATLSWTVGEVSGSSPMQASGSTWSAAVGPFGDGTIPPGTSEAVVLRIVARDAAGNVAERTSSSALTLNDCTFS